MIFSYQSLFRNTGITEYDNLANAVIMQAVDDYRQARQFLKEHPATKELREHVRLRSAERKRIYKLTRQKLPLDDREKLLMKISRTKKDAKDIERFFHSSWYTVLTDVPGDYILDRLKEEFK